MRLKDIPTWKIVSMLIGAAYTWALQWANELMLGPVDRFEYVDPKDLDAFLMGTAIRDVGRKRLDL